MLFKREFLFQRQDLHAYIVLKTDLAIIFSTHMDLSHKRNCSLGRSTLALDIATVM